MIRQAVITRGLRSTFAVSVLVIAALLRLALPADATTPAEVDNNVMIGLGSGHDDGKHSYL